MPRSIKYISSVNEGDVEWGRETFEIIKRRWGVSCRDGVSFPLSLHSIFVSILFCNDNHWTQFVQLFWTFFVENSSFHILNNFTLNFLHNLNYSIYMCVMHWKHMYLIQQNLAWNKLLFKGFVFISRARPVYRTNSLIEVLITAITQTQNVISKQHWLCLTVGRAYKQRVSGCPYSHTFSILGFQHKKDIRKISILLLLWFITFVHFR